MRLIVLVLLTFLLIPIAHATVNIDSCQNLNVPGVTYTLTRDIITSTDCFTIEEATLDCKGHAITAAGRIQGANAIKLNNGATVKNCLINEDKDNGIFVTAIIFQEGVAKADNVIIRLSSAGFRAVQFDPETQGSKLTNSYIQVTGKSRSGLYLGGSGAIIENSTIISKTNRWALEVASPNNIIRENQLESKRAATVHITSGNNNSFYNNTISGNKEGVVLSSAASKQTFVDNFVNASGLGFSIQFSHQNIFRNNYVCSPKGFECESEDFGYGIDYGNVYFWADKDCTNHWLGPSQGYCADYGKNIEIINTCSDGRRNQNEEGIDCGGECPPCRSNRERSSSIAQAPTQSFEDVNSSTPAIKDKSRWPLQGFTIEVIFFVFMLAVHSVNIMRRFRN